MTSIENLPALPQIICKVRIYYYDTDAGGVVHNISYLRHIEEARTKLAEHLGWSLRDMALGPIVPVVRRTEIDYIAPARLGDDVEIYASLQSLGTASFDVYFEMFSFGVGKKLVNCLQKMVCVRLPTMRPTRVPAYWREKWPHLVDNK